MPGEHHLHAVARPDVFLDASHRAFEGVLSDVAFALGEAGQRSGRGREPVPVIGLQVPCPAIGTVVPIEISVWSPDDLKGALKPDARGLRWRGTLSGLTQLLQAPTP